MFFKKSHLVRIIINSVDGCLIGEVSPCERDALVQTFLFHFRLSFQLKPDLSTRCGFYPVPYFGILKMSINQYNECNRMPLPKLSFHLIFPSRLFLFSWWRIWWRSEHHSTGCAGKEEKSSSDNSLIRCTSTNTSTSPPPHTHKLFIIHFPVSIVSILRAQKDSNIFQFFKLNHLILLILWCGLSDKTLWMVRKFITSL